MKKEMISNWQTLLSNRLGKSTTELMRDGLSCGDFTADYVEVLFDDGSYCRFNHAFAIVDHEKREVAVFTQHCGYHTFSSLGASVFEYHDSIKHVVS